MTEIVRQRSPASDDSTIYAYEVEKILGKRGTGQNIEYFIKWKNYDSSYNSWVLESNCDCPDLIKTFEATKKKPKRSDKKRLISKKPKSSNSSGPGSSSSHSGHRNSSAFLPRLLPNDGSSDSTVTLQQQLQESVEPSEQQDIVEPGPSVQVNRRVRFGSPLNVQTFKYDPS